jgi:hypothetical protein
MIFIADKKKIVFVWEHLHDIGNNAPTLNFYKGFRFGEAFGAKTFAKAGHGNDNLHKFYKYKSLIIAR